MTPQEQAHAFAAMLAAGVCLGGVYDLLMPLRSGVCCAAADLLFGVLCAAGIIAAALLRQCDAFRLYAFAGAACGMILYGLTLGRLVRFGIRICQKRWKKVRKAAETGRKSGEGAEF